MSATNRGSKRVAADYYPTPIATIQSILPLLPKTEPFYDPCEGDGRIVEQLRMSGRFATGNDIIPLPGGFKASVDFLAATSVHRFIITNPPFSLAREFIQHSLEHADETMMLLRLNFLGSQKRRDWWKQHEPDAIFVLSDRPDFTGGGGDACDYGWFYWGFRYNGIHHL